MVSALNGFGMAIGCMDITGAVFFELMIIYMLCRRNGARTTADDTKEQQQGHVASTRLKGGPLWPVISLFLKHFQRSMATGYALGCCGFICSY